MFIYRNLVKEYSLILKHQVKERNDSDCIIHVFLFVWFLVGFFFPPAVWDDEEEPTMISVCLSPGVLPLGRQRVVGRGESPSYSKGVQVRGSHGEWRNRAVGKGMWDLVLCLPMTDYVTFASLLISISSTEKKKMTLIGHPDQPSQEEWCQEKHRPWAHGLFFSLGSLALVRSCKPDPVFCICKMEIRKFFPQ